MAWYTEIVPSGGWGLTLEVGSIYGMIMAATNKNSDDSSLFFASMGLYVIGRAVSNIKLKREIMNERKELSDKL